MTYDNTSRKTSLVACLSIKRRMLDDLMIELPRDINKLNNVTFLAG